MNQTELEEALRLYPEDFLRIDRAACLWNVPDPKACRMNRGLFCRNSGCPHYSKEKAEIERTRIIAEKARATELE